MVGGDESAGGSRVPKWGVFFLGGLLFPFSFLSFFLLASFPSFFFSFLLFIFSCVHFFFPSFFLFPFKYSIRFTFRDEE